MWKGPGQCVILCIIVNIIVTGELSVLLFNFRILSCFFFFFKKRKIMILSWCCFVLHSKRQVEILIVVVVKVFSYWLNVKNVCLLKMLMSKDLLYNFTFNIDVIQKFHIRSIRTQEGEVIMFCHKTNTFSFHQCGWMDLMKVILPLRGNLHIIPDLTPDSEILPGLPGKLQPITLLFYLQWNTTLIIIVFTQTLY